MNKVALIVVLSLLFSSCATNNLRYKINKDIEQEQYIQEKKSIIPNGSSILVVGAFANKATRYLVEELEKNLEESMQFDIISSKAITEKFPSYPTNILSPLIEREREFINGFETVGNKKIEKIGTALNANYVFMVYLDEADKVSLTTSELFFSTYELGLSYKVKGTLWDIRNNHSVGQSYFFRFGSSAMQEGLFGNNIYSETEVLIEKIAKKAANDISKRIIKENK